MALKLDLLGIVTADMKRSLRFYRMLDIDIPKPEGDEPHVEVTLPSGLRLAWDSLELIKQITPDWEEPRGNRLALAFLCGSPQQVEEKFREITGAGFEGVKEPWDAFWGQRYAIVKDPDGNSIDLFAPLGE
jgi:catechol 2,3-dioxygenase-like lactoylglutathione lyase family enzyme